MSPARGCAARQNLELGWVDGRRFSHRCTPSRAPGPASRAFKPWVRVPTCRQEIRFWSSPRFGEGGPDQMSNSAQGWSSPPSWSRARFVEDQSSRTRWIEVFCVIGEQSPPTLHAPRRTQPSQSLSPCSFTALVTLSRQRSSASVRTFEPPARPPCQPHGWQGSGCDTPWRYDGRTTSSEGSGRRQAPLGGHGARGW